MSKSEDNKVDPDRRQFVSKLTVAVGAVGVAGACWPFISSMNPSRDIKAKATTTVDLSSISKGQAETVEWQGKPVFIVNRTDEQVADMQDTNTGIDPQDDLERVQQPNWLVVLGLCTHLGCVPSRSDEGWVCPCHDSVYDNSGRVLQGPAPKNLLVPQYEFVGEKKIIIGKQA